MLISVENSFTMILNHNIILLFLFCVTSTWGDTQADLKSNDLNEVNSEVELLDNNDDHEINGNLRDLVHIQYYYETMDMIAVIYYDLFLLPVAKDLFHYLSIDTYPFGNAEIITDNDTVEFKCPHGPDECYGNKLHACANSYLFDFSVLFNGCVFENSGDMGCDDESVDKCGEEMDVDSDRIIDCAKGTEGTELLLYYGELTKKAKVPFIPYILVNGKMYDVNTDVPLKEYVCAAFSKKPPPCENVHM